MVDAASDDDLVERRFFLPAVIAVGVLAGDRLIFRIAARDEGIVAATRSRRQRLDDLDRPDLVGQVREIGTKKQSLSALPSPIKPE